MSYSLDRTNVVQSALAKWVLNNQLREIGVLSVKESVDEHSKFLDLFRNSKSSLMSEFLRQIIELVVVYQSGPTTRIPFQRHTLALEHSRLTTPGG